MRPRSSRKMENNRRGFVSRIAKMKFSHYSHKLHYCKQENSYFSAFSVAASVTEQGGARLGWQLSTKIKNQKSSVLECKRIGLGGTVSAASRCCPEIALKKRSEDWKVANCTLLGENVFPDWRDR
jgi:hypothetical protein